MRKATSSALAVIAFGVVLNVSACGTKPVEEQPFDASAVFADAGDRDAHFEVEDLPKWCGPGAPPPAAQVGGTRECPDDLNHEGCPCPAVGAKAACWTGKRYNRNHGVCKDGQTECIGTGELGKSWGPCVGATLPTPGAPPGAASCTCFSQGEWHIDNVVPCFVNSNGKYYATSTKCPANSTDPPPPDTTPTAPWSPNTLTVDCAGHFKLCYTIKAGEASNPKPDDCAITTQCTEGEYPTAKTPTKFPDLAGWVSNDQACVKKMLDGSPLYGEMTVIGKSYECDDIAVNGQAFVFNRVPYCKLNDKTCVNSGSGKFPP